MLSCRYVVLRTLQALAAPVFLFTYFPGLLRHVPVPMLLVQFAAPLFAALLFLPVRGRHQNKEANKQINVLPNSKLLACCQVRELYWRKNPLVSRKTASSQVAAFQALYNSFLSFFQTYLPTNFLSPRSVCLSAYSARPWETQSAPCSIQAHQCASS
jgi:hypothetical protein